MAVTFPRTDLINFGVFEQMTFAPMARQELASRTAGGSTVGKDFGSAVWVAEYQTGPMSHSDAVTYEAKLRSLNGVIESFEAYDLRRPYPAAHPLGDFSDSGFIGTIGLNNKSLSLVDLPAGLQLSVGDYLSFDYDDDARALHQVMEAATANGSGDTTEFEVYPHIRALTLSPSRAVRLLKPAALFKLAPNSASARVVGKGMSSVSFRAVQYLP